MNAGPRQVLRVCLVFEDSNERIELESKLGGDKSIAIAGSFHRLERALPRLRETRPDVVLLDHCSSALSWGAAIDSIKREWPATRVRVATSLSGDHALLGALENGADGLVEKDRPAGAYLRAAIRATYEGAMPLPERARIALAKKLRLNRPEGSAWNLLTPREQAIVVLLKEGLGNKALARQLNLSVETVRTHLKHIFDKLGIHDRYGVILKLWGGGETMSGHFDVEGTRSP